MKIQSDFKLNIYLQKCCLHLICPESQQKDFLCLTRFWDSIKNTSLFYYLWYQKAEVCHIDEIWMASPYNDPVLFHIYSTLIHNHWRIFVKWLTNGSQIKTRTERRKVREVEDKCSLIVNVAFHLRDWVCPVLCTMFWFLSILLNLFFSFWLPTVCLSYLSICFDLNVFSFNCSSMVLHTFVFLYYITHYRVIFH